MLSLFHIESVASEFLAFFFLSFLLCVLSDLIILTLTIICIVIVYDRQLMKKLESSRTVTLCILELIFRRYILQFLDVLRSLINTYYMRVMVFMFNAIDSVLVVSTEFRLHEILIVDQPFTYSSTFMQLVHDQGQIAIFMINLYSYI